MSEKDVKTMITINKILLFKVQRLKKDFNNIFVELLEALIYFFKKNFKKKKKRIKKKLSN